MLLKTMSNKIFRSFKKISITNKITLLYGCIFSVVFILTSIFLMVNAVFFYQDTSRQELIEIADKVSGYINSDTEITDNILKELKPNKNTDIRVIDATASINKSSAPPQDAFQQQNGKMPFPPINKDNMHDEDKKVHFNVNRGMTYMFYDKFIIHNGHQYIIQVYRHYQKEQQILRFFGIIFIVSNVLGIFGVFLIGKYISKILLRPITVISQTAERISIEDFNQRINIEGPDDEVKQLAVTFNEMICRLEDAFNEQSQFISDASHELRTPISVIQGYANLIDRWGKSDPEVLQESIDSIKAETEHMAELVKKLLFLAKEEQNKKQLQKKPLLLNYVANEVIKEFSVMEMNKNISFNISLVEESEETIYGDFNLIKQLIWIFIENSIKYSKDASSDLIIKIFREDNKSCFSVKDNGIGIEGEDLPFIFKRFYRADKSRSKEIPGTGLGLSIADWIIKQHEATVRAESVVGVGTEIIVSFTAV